MVFSGNLTGTSLTCFFSWRCLIPWWRWLKVLEVLSRQQWRQNWERDSERERCPGWLPADWWLVSGCLCNCETPGPRLIQWPHSTTLTLKTPHCTANINRENKKYKAVCQQLNVWLWPVLLNSDWRGDNLLQPGMWLPSKIPDIWLATTQPTILCSSVVDINYQLSSFININI